MAHWVHPYWNGSVYFDSTYWNDTGDSTQEVQDSIACVVPRVLVGAVYSRYLPNAVASVIDRDRWNARQADKWMVDREFVKSISQNTSLIDGEPMHPQHDDVIINMNRQLYIQCHDMQTINIRSTTNTELRQPEIRIHTHPVLCRGKRCCNE